MSSVRQGTVRHAFADRGEDLYETPVEAVEALVRNISDKRPTIWEPAAGPGAIVRVLRSHGFPVIATELVDRGERNCPDGEVGVDFIATKEKRADFIITNPPFKLADQFIRHGLRLGCAVTVLLRLAALEGVRRSDLVDNHLVDLMVFRDRLPMMHRDGWEGPRTSSTTPYAWFTFAPDGRLPGTHAQLRRISWREAA